jgi:hypothetical protein
LPGLASPTITTQFVRVDELAEKVAAQPAALFRMMRLLASLGVFEQTPGRRFALTPVGVRFKARRMQSTSEDYDMNISLKSGLLSMLCGALAIVATAGIALGWPIGLIDARNVGDPSPLVAKAHYSKLPARCYGKPLGAFRARLARKGFCKALSPAECALILGRPAPWGCMICYPPRGGGPRWSAILRSTCEQR